MSYPIPCVSGTSPNVSQPRMAQTWITEDGYKATAIPIGSFPYSSPLIVELQAAPRRKQIYQNFIALGATLNRHESTIHKRWLKKTREQRRKILLAAWAAHKNSDNDCGTFPTVHRPDFATFFEGLDRSPGQSNRTAFLLPLLNQEDLVTPRRLLLLLQSRARLPPSTFAITDYENMQLGIRTLKLQGTAMTGHVFVFVGREFPAFPADKYYELVHRNNYPGTFDTPEGEVDSLFMSVQRMGGLLVLEAQDRLLSFLMGCVREILHDVPQELMSRTLCGLLPEERTFLAAASSSFDDAEENLSWSSLAADSHYRPPCEMDFAKLESLFAASRDDALDHIWSMREDPSYWTRRLLALKEHQPEIVQDSDGRQHPWFTSGREDILWRRLIVDEIERSYCTYERFVELRAQTAHLCALQRILPSFSTRDRLPQAYLAAIDRLASYLGDASHGPEDMVKRSFEPSPPMRQFFVRISSRNVMDADPELRLKLDAQFDRSQRRLYWIISTMRKQYAGLFRTNDLTDVLQHLIDTDSSAKAAVSDLMAASIADMGVILEGVRQVQLLHRWEIPLHKLRSTQTRSVSEEMKNWQKPWGRWKIALERNSQVLSKHGAPLGRRFHYPVEKRRTCENVNLLRKAEADLDLFWSKVDQAIGPELLKGTALGRLMSTPRTLQRTAPWVEKLKPVSPNIHSSRASIAEELLQPFSQVYLDLQYRTERTIEHDSSAEPSNTEKVKTRGTARSSIGTLWPENYDPNSSSLPISTTATSSVPQFPLDARALKTFRTLFYTPSATGTPGEVAWTDFLNALAAVGLTARKLYGSVWQFSPKAVGEASDDSISLAGRSIHFHEPHPSGKLAYCVARRYGRRLNRAYGLESTMFVLKSAVQKDMTA